MNKTMLIIGVMFFCIGGLFLYITGKELIFMMEFKDSSQEVYVLVEESLKKVSTDSEGSETISYENHVTYEVDSKEYYSTYRTNTKKQEGSTQIVYYYEKDPSIIKISQSISGSAFAVVFSSIFVIVGACVLCNALRLTFGNFAATTNRKKARAIITDIYSAQTNGFIRYVLKCEYSDYSTGKVITMVSNNIKNFKGYYGDAEALRGQLVGREVEVMVNDTNPNDYVVNYKKII